SLLERLNTWIMAHPALAPSVWIAGIALVALVAHLVTRRIVLPLLGKITARSSVRWDEVLLEHGVFHRAAWLVPLIIFYQGLTTVPNLPEGLHTLLARLALCTMILAGVRAFAG